MSDMTIEERRAIVERLKSVGYSPGSALDNLTVDVRMFHLLFGHPAPTKPRMQGSELVARRAKWIRSEVVELEVAEDVTEQVDAYLDIIYFAVGGLVEIGVHFPHRMWARVQRANIEKVNADGSVTLVHGKVQKPEGWTAPDADIEAYIKEEQNGSGLPLPQRQGVITELANECVRRLSLAEGKPMLVLLMAVDDDGTVTSSSNMDLGDQRDFIRFVYSSFATGDVTPEDKPEVRVGRGAVGGRDGEDTVQ